MQDQYQIVIIGGGITGLSAAFSLQQQARENGLPLRITLLEESHTLGGKIVTDNEQGFTIEGGPDCFIRQKPWAAQLCQKLGIGDQLIGTNDDRRKVFVVNRGRLTPLPDGVMLIVPTRIWPFVTSPLISLPGKARMGLDLFVPKISSDADESVASFVLRRLGREALEKIAEPLMGGIHVSDPEEQSLLATFPRFRNLEKEHGSLIRGMLAQRRKMHNPAESGKNGGSTAPGTMFISLRAGLGQLVSGLSAALTGVEITTGQKVEGVSRDGSGGYLVSCEAGQAIRADAVLFATPANVSAGLLAGLDPVLSRDIGQIRYISTATISLAYRASDAGRYLNGFGFVVPRNEKRQISACTYTSTKFDQRAPQHGALVRCFVGGPGKEEMLERTDAELIQAARLEMESLMGLKAEPLFARVYRWEKGNPQYAVGHLELVSRIRVQCQTHPGLEVAGSAFDGVGVPDCVRQGTEAAGRLVAYLKQTSLSLSAA